MFIGRIVEVAALVKKLHRFGQGEETVGKAGSNVDLILMLGRKQHGGPFSEMRGADADIHCHVKSFTFNDAAQFCPGMTELVMKSSKFALAGTGVVVLNKNIRDAEVGKFSP